MYSHQAWLHVCIKLKKLETWNNKQLDTTPLWDECHQQHNKIRTLAFPFNKTHQLTQRCLVAIPSFKINKPHHVIGYTNDPIIRQQSNKNMPYNQTSHASLMKRPVKLKTKIEA